MQSFLLEQKNPFDKTSDKVHSKSQTAHKKKGMIWLFIFLNKFSIYPNNIKTERPLADWKHLGWPQEQSIFFFFF